jgi:putative salt-induced outer membrane protein
VAHRIPIKSVFHRRKLIQRGQLIAGLVLATAAHGVAAQFDRPALSSAPVPLEIKPDGKWRGLLGAGLTASSGNTRSIGLNLLGDGVRATDSSRLSLSSQVLYGQSVIDGKRTRTADQWRAGARHDWSGPDAPLYFFTNGGAERDPLRQLALRAVAGAGLGYRNVRGPDERFEVFGGLGWRTDRFTGPGSNINGELRTRYDTAELQIGEESSHRLSDNTTWRQRITLFPNLRAGGELRAVFESVLSVSMSRNLVLTVSLSDRYDTQATAPIKRNDVLLYTGINLRVGAH